MILLPPITNRTDTIVPNTTLLRSSCQLFGRKHACPLSRRRAPPTPRPASLPLRGYSPAERRPESRPPPNSFLSLPGADWPCHPAEDRGLTGRRPTPPILYSAFFRRAPPKKGGGLGSSATLTHDCHWGPRSEEHTSELQSLMRISYAVFCLKKK